MEEILTGFYCLLAFILGALLIIWFNNTLSNSWGL